MDENKNENLDMSADENINKPVENAENTSEADTVKPAEENVETKAEEKKESVQEDHKEAAKEVKKEEKKKSSTTALIIAIVVAVIAIALLIFFLFFYKNKNVRDTESAIDAIGNVTLDSGELIDDAEALYDALTDKEQGQVDNYQILEDARDKYTELCDKDAAAQVDLLISHIGEVDRSSENKIIVARDAYESLTKQQKKYVEKLDVLEKAEEDFDVLDVKECEELIDKIADAADSPELQLPIAINKARSAYDALSLSHKKMVSNYDNLVAAEEAYDNYAQQSDALKIKEEHAERLADRESYMNSCQAVTYAQLISNPETYEGKDVAIKVDIVYVDKAAFLKSGTVVAIPSGGRVDNVMSLVDKRSVKEPEFAEGTTLTVYGVFEGVENVTEYVEGSGFLGTSLFAKVASETMVPEITVNFTSTDDIAAIDEKPTKTEIFNYIEEGLDLAKGVTDIIKQIPW